MKKLFLLFMSLPIYANVMAQEEIEKPYTLTAYLDLYYTYDFNMPNDNNRPAFVYSHSRHNETNLNLGIIKATYEQNNLCGNFALMTGTYTNANLAAEPGVLKNIYEANAGIKLSSSKDLWIDAGILPSHIGFESAISKDCWNLTRSIMAENSPYYEAGVRLAYTNVKKNWYLAALVLNGWQRIQRIEGNSIPSFGTQITFTPGSRLTLNSSTFIGTDKPDSAQLMRYFHNFYAIAKLSETFSLAVGIDIGFEERSPTQSRLNTWHTSVLQIQMKANEKIKAAVRGEYFKDPHAIITSKEQPNFMVRGLTANFDYTVAPNVLWRIELKHYNSTGKVFERHNEHVRTNTSITTSMSLNF